MDLSGGQTSNNGRKTPKFASIETTAARSLKDSKKNLLQKGDNFELKKMKKNDRKSRDTLRLEKMD